VGSLSHSTLSGLFLDRRNTTTVLVFLYPRSSPPFRAGKILHAMLDIERWW
jgi:hypothetical protein